MRAVDVALNSLGVDSVADPSPLLLNSQRYSVVAGYLGSITPSKLARILAAGKTFSPVTYGGWRPATLTAEAALKELRRLSIPAGVTIWLDLEAQLTGSHGEIIEAVNRWAGPINQAQYIAGLYVGAGHQLTSDELHRLLVYRYWQGCSRLTDRYGQIAEPKNGFCGRQAYPPNQIIDGTQVDVDFYQQDFRGRVATVVAA